METILLICVLPCRDGVFKRLEVSKIDKVTINAYLNFPFQIACVPANTSVSRFVFTHSPLITSVCSAVYITQICPLIVATIAINVINFERWPFASHGEKRQSMFQVLPATYTDYSIRLSTTHYACTSGPHSGFHVLPVYKPCKFTSPGVV
jgi:hypothetical protein